MFSRVRIAIRFFFVGLAVGVLLAPRSGEQTRRMLREKADRLLNDVLDAASLGSFNPSSAGTDSDEDSSTRGTRTGNGSGTKARTRAPATTEASA